MPAPAKLDLIPPELRAWLREALEARGFAEIVAVTEELNFRLQECGLEVSIGKTAVGRFSKALKDQREAFSIAETLLSDMDIAAEGELHKVLVQMIASGEASGELDHMLTRAADYQERELSSTVNTMVGLLGPIMLLFMAGVVVLIVLSVMLPIMQMNNLLAG